MGNRKVVMLERSEASMEILDFGPFGRRPLIHFAQDEQQRNAILNVAKISITGEWRILQCSG